MSALWEQEGLHYEADIQEGISLQVPDDLRVGQHPLDNPHCDPQELCLQLANYKPWLRKAAVLTVSNDYAAGQAGTTISSSTASIGPDPHPPSS